MVTIPRLLEDLFTMVRGNAHDHEPKWARDLSKKFDESQDLLRSLHRRVTIFMSADRDQLARLTGVLAGALPLIKSKIERVAELEAENARLKGEKAEDESQDLAAQNPLAEVIDQLDILVNGPKTPDVAPVPVEEAPAVLDGSQDVTAPDGGDVAPGSDDSVNDPGPVENGGTDPVPNS